MYDELPLFEADDPTQRATPERVVTPFKTGLVRQLWRATLAGMGVGALLAVMALG